jgi:hypothetical protein
MSRTNKLNPFCALLALWLLGNIGSATGNLQQGPQVTLRLPAFGNIAFPPTGTIVVPAQGLDCLELWLQHTLADLRLSSIRVYLNEQSVSTFLSVNPLPKGVRAILRLNQTLNPALGLSPGFENMLLFEAVDIGGNRYRARFFISIDASVSRPTVGVKSYAVEPEGVVIPPPTPEVPSFRWDLALPAATAESAVNVAVTITDKRGLRRVVVEKNGKDVEEIIVENGRPIRKSKGFRVSSKLPGYVAGDGKSLEISLPMELRKGLNTIVFRAENMDGLRARTDRTIERQR